MPAHGRLWLPAACPGLSGADHGPSWALPLGCRRAVIAPGAGWVLMQVVERPEDAALPLTHNTCEAWPLQADA
jgi:hypothetical protein